MTLTSNSDFTTITITSDNLSSLGSVDKIVLNGKINCSGTYSYEVDKDDITSGTFTINLTSLFGTSTLQDSVYSFILTITNSDDSIIKEYNCLFVDNDTKCDIVDCVTESNNLELQLDYYLLSRAQNCDCDCSDLCIIYNRLKNEQTRCKSC